MRLAILLAALALLAGCATLSEDQCRAGDWVAIGLADGAAGRPTGYLAEHAEACAEYGISPETEAWLAGRAEGLLTYCTPSNAYRVGRGGRAISPVCPASARVPMQTPWERGRAYHRLELDIRQIDRDIDSIWRRLAYTPPEDPVVKAALAQELSFLRLRRQTLELRQLPLSSWP